MTYHFAVLAVIGMLAAGCCCNRPPKPDPKPKPGNCVVSCGSFETNECTPDWGKREEVGSWSGDEAKVITYQDAGLAKAAEGQRVLQCLNYNPTPPSADATKAQEKGRQGGVIVPCLEHRSTFDMTQVVEIGKECRGAASAIVTASFAKTERGHDDVRVAAIGLTRDLKEYSGQYAYVAPPDVAACTEAGIGASGEWRQVTVTLTLPPNTKYVAIVISVGNNAEPNSFRNNFIDDVRIAFNKAK